MGHPTQREPPPQRVQPSPTPKAIFTVSLPATTPFLQPTSPLHRTTAQEHPTHPQPSTPPQAPAPLCQPGSPTCPLHPVTPPNPRCALSPQDHRLPKSPHPATREAQPRTHSTILTCLLKTRDPTPLRSPPTMRSPHRHRPMPLPESHRPSRPPCAASSDRVFTLALPLRATDKQSHERTIRDFSGRPSGA